MAFAAQPGGSDHGVRSIIKSVRQDDGRVVERLILPTATPESTLGEPPRTMQTWLDQSLDPAWMAKMVKDPQLFARWLDVVTEPRFMTALATTAVQPGAYPQAAGRFLAPANVRNWSELANPAVFMAWMTAGMDPRYYLTIFNRLADPRKAMRWAGWPVGAEPQNAPDAVAQPAWLSLPGVQPATAASRY